MKLPEFLINIWEDERKKRILIAILIILSILLSLLLGIYLAKSNQSTKKVPSNKNNSQINTISTPTTTPSPSLTPTPLVSNSNSALKSDSTKITDDIQAIDSEIKLIDDSLLEQLPNLSY